LKVIIILFAFFYPSASTAQAKDSLYAEITFDRTQIDTGKINQLAPCVFQYRFKNTGNIPLSINYVHSSCNCIEPTWSKEKIVPGGYGFVSCIYDTKSKSGNFSKTVLVYSNHRKGRQVAVQLVMKGYVAK